MAQNVMVGYLHSDTLTQEFHHCLFKLFIHDTWGPQHVRRFAGQYSGANICKGRNQLVHDFLEDDRCDWLWILDDDATFHETMLDGLLASADPLERPIVGALAHQYRGRNDEDGNPVFGTAGIQIREPLPTMYKIEWGPDGEWLGYREATSYHLGLNEVDATGAHCLLVHRTVFEAIKSDHPYRWFREDEIAPGTICGEDIWFCIAARRAGFPIYVNTQLEAGHVKPVVLTSEMSSIERVAS
jgi:GT2 family glycosyltransferase